MCVIKCDSAQMFASFHCKKMLAAYLVFSQIFTKANGFRDRIFIPSGLPDNGPFLQFVTLIYDVQ